MFLWLRFTPTHVGTTEYKTDWLKCPTVHPHTRGDHLRNLRAVGFHAGSPPHTWGPLKRHHLRAGDRRFTPTHVGTTLRKNGTYRNFPVHPHTRGDHIVADYDHVAGAGSPPHTWGPLFCQCLLLGFWRFTPTHVGTTAQTTVYK